MRCLKRLGLGVARGALGPFHALHFGGDLLLLVGERLGLTHRVLHIAFAATGLVLLQPLLRLLDLVERRRRLCARVARSVRRRLLHRVGRVLQLARCVGEVLPLLLAGELLEPSRRFLHFLRELSLRVAATAAARLLAGGRQALLPLGFLLLTPRQLLQLLGELVDLLVGALLLGALLHLVLVGELVEFELEQVGEVLGHLVLSAAATAATALLRDLHFVLLLGILQQLQRPLLGRQRFLGLQSLEVALGRLHLAGRFRQRFGDGLERRVDRVEPAVHLAAEFLDLLAQLGLREREEHGLLAELVRRTSSRDRARC